MLRFLRRVLSPNSPLVLAPAAQVAARARAPVRRHPSGISARVKRGSKTGPVGASWRAQGGRVKWRPLGATRPESLLGGGR